MTRRRGSAALAALAVLGLLALAVAFIALTPRRADAHALLASSDPPINAALRESPTEVNLFLTEPLQTDFSRVRVLDSAGRRVDLGATAFSDVNAAQMSVAVRRLEPGIYTVVWRSLSTVDGHVWNGSYAFSVLNSDGSAPSGAALTISDDQGGTPTAADAVVRAVGLAALIAAAGWLLYWLIAPPPPDSTHRRAFGRTGIAVLSAALLLGMAATVYEAVANAVDLGGLGALDSLLFGSRNGLWLQVRLAALALAALTLTAWRFRSNLEPMPPRPVVRSLAVLALVWLISTAAVSHAAAAPAGSAWSAFFDAVHLAAAAVWVGLLAVVAIAFRRIADNGWRIALVQRFSIIAAASVPLLIVAGLLSVLIHVPEARGLTDTDWGAAFIVKLALLSLLFAVAAANAWFLRPRFAAAPSPLTTLRLRRAMRIELALMAAVLVATGFLSQLPVPAGAVDDGARKDRTAEFTAVRADLAANVRIAPNVVGFNDWEIEIADRDGGIPDDPVEQLRVRFRYRDDPAVGPVTVAAAPLGDGRFALSGAYFGLPGRWSVELETRRARGDDLVLAIDSDVESDYASVRPFDTDPPGAFSLPLTQMDWNGVAALWAFALGALLLINRPHLRGRFGPRGGDAAFAFGGGGLILAVVLLTGLEVEPGRTLANPVLLTNQSIERGEILYANNCRACHGDTGAGDGPLADTLPAPPANFSVHVPFHPDGVLYVWISDGIRGTGMPAWRPSLSDQERWDLVNFLRANFDSAARPAADP